MEVDFLNGTTSSRFFLPFDDEPHILDNPYVRGFLILLYTIIFILCCFGNLAVVLVVTLHWKMRSITKFCLGNMAFANLCVGIFCVYQNLTTYLLDSWYFGDFMCKIYHFINTLCHTASILILVVVSIERYMVLLHPFKFRRILTIRRLVWIVIGVWILSALICLPRLFYFGLLRIPISETLSGDICVPKKSMYNSATADTIYFVLLYVFPLTVISILYARIALYLRKSSALLRTNMEESLTNNVVLSPTSIRLDVETGQIRFNASRAQKKITEELNKSLRNQMPSSSVSSTSTSGFVFNFRGHFISQEDNLNTPKTLQIDQHVQCVWRSSVRKNKSYRHHPYSHHQRNSFHDVDDLETFRLAHRPNILRRHVRRFYIGREYHSEPDRPSNEASVTYSAGEIRKNSRLCLSSSSPTNNASSASSLIPTRVIVTSEASNGTLHNFNIVQLTRIRHKQRRTVVRMLMAIVVTFALLNLPFHLRKLCINYLPSFDIASDTTTVIAPLTYVFMYSNSALNPILYAFLSKQFRSSLRDLLRCQRRRSSSTRLAAFP